MPTIGELKKLVEDIPDECELVRVETDPPEGLRVGFQDEGGAYAVRFIFKGIRTSCDRCEGCGKIANSEDGEPWIAWLALPPGSDLAVKLGQVQPIDCPECGGSGDRI
ncbi:MAG: hypothetical protein GY769_07740 [bacterium]|nr:hypothetical protein [bacterium]